MHEFDSSPIKALLQITEGDCVSMDQWVPFFYLTLNASQGTVSVINADSTIVYINPALSHSINLPLGDVIGTRLKDRLTDKVGMLKFAETVLRVIPTGSHNLFLLQQPQIVIIV